MLAKALILQPIVHKDATKGRFQMAAPSTRCYNATTPETEALLDLYAKAQGAFQVTFAARMNRIEPAWSPRVSATLSELLRDIEADIDRCVSEGTIVVSWR